MKFYATIVVEANTIEDFEGTLMCLRELTPHKIVAEEYPLPAFYDPEFDCPICNQDGYECNCNATQDQIAAAEKSREYLAKLMYKARTCWADTYTMPIELWTDIWGLDSEIRKLVD